MPTGPSGIYTLPPSYLATAGETIRTEQHNAPLEDIAQGLTDRLSRSGVAPMAGNLQMGANKITNIAAATAAGDVPRFDQVATASPTLTSLAALGTTGNRIAYTTAQNTWAEAPLTAFARTLLDDADAPTARATLGAQANLGFTPVRQGGGPGQLANQINIGWGGNPANGTRLSVDGNDQGRIAFFNEVPLLPAGWNTLRVFPNFGESYTLPTGGSWLAFLFQVRNNGEVPNTAFEFGVYSGGQVFGAPAATFCWRGFAWRVQ